MIFSKALILLGILLTAQAARHKQAPIQELAQVQAKEVDFDPSVEKGQMVTSLAESGQINLSQTDTAGDGKAVRSCLIELGDNIFNFEALKLKGSEYKLHTLGTPAIPHNYTLFFNVCDYTTHRCSDVKTMDSANSVNNNQTCEHLSGSDATDLKASLQSESHPEYGVNLKMTHGNACTATKNYGLDLQINCDAGAAKTSYHLDINSISVDECTPKVIMNTPYGCPVFGMPPVWRWVDSNRILICAVFIIVGGLLLGVGGRYYLATMAAISTFGMACFMLVLLYGLVLPTTTPQWMVWLSVFLCFAIGGGLGYAAYNWPKIGIFVIGAVVGAFVGTILYTLFFSGYAQSVKPAVPGNLSHLGGLTPAQLQYEELKQLWWCILACAGIFAFLSLVFFDYTVIYGSCLCGSYLFIRGLSMIFGGFPNEFLIYDALLNHKLLQQQGILFVYLLAIFFTAAIMINYQLKQRALHLELYSYKKYDFRYRKATKSGVPNTGANRAEYDALPEDNAPQEEEHQGDDEV